MNIKKISLFLLTTLTIWSISFDAMEKKTPKKIIPKQPLQIYKIITDSIAKKTAEKRARFESKHHWKTAKTVSYTEIYNQEYKKEYDRLIDEYKDYEENWKIWKEGFEQYELKREGSWVKQLIGGNFNYAMTLNEIKQIIKKKFMAMKQKGFIISRDQYEKNKDKYYHIKHNNLTRIWGAEYLNKGFEEAKNKNYDTPGYVIVANNPNKINILLYIEDIRFPIASGLKKNEAFIAFVKIIGYPAGDPVYHGHKLPMQLGYVDLGSSRRKDINVRKVVNGKYYIVDTELKSFQHSDSGLGYRKHYILPHKDDFEYYAYKKFLYFNDDAIIGLDIPLTINLK